MEVRAISRYIRISPRKTRLVIDLIRGKNASESLEILEAMNKRAARITGIVLGSAVANARQKELDVDKLWIKEAKVDGGPAYKRFMPRAMGRATMIRKPTSHINIVLSDEIKGQRAETDVTKTAEDTARSGKKSLLGKIRKKKTGGDELRSKKTLHAEKVKQKKTIKDKKSKKGKNKNK